MIEGTTLDRGTEYGDNLGSRTLRVRQPQRWGADFVTFFLDEKKGSLMGRIGNKFFFLWGGKG